MTTEQTPEVVKILHETLEQCFLLHMLSLMYQMSGVPELFKGQIRNLWWAMSFFLISDHHPQFPSLSSPNPKHRSFFLSFSKVPCFFPLVSLCICCSICWNPWVPALWFPGDFFSFCRSQKSITFICSLPFYLPTHTASDPNSTLSLPSSPDQFTCSHTTHWLFS